MSLVHCGVTAGAVVVGLVGGAAVVLAVDEDAPDEVELDEESEERSEVVVPRVPVPELVLEQPTSATAAASATALKERLPTSIATPFRSTSCVASAAQILLVFWKAR